MVLLIALQTPIYSTAQKDSLKTWYSFSDESGELVGYKDHHQKVMIPPVFPGYAVTANKFDHLIGVIEVDQNQQSRSYYLLKSGQKIAHDSVYFFDNIQDCESEGSMRFLDPVTHKMGFLNYNGKILIDAFYNWASPIHNDLSFVIKNAEKYCLDESIELENCEHWGWKGGEHLLINRRNEIIARNINEWRNLNPFSIEMEESSGTNSDRVYFEGEKTKFVSFINYEKEFANWLNKLSANQNWQNSVFEEVTHWDSEKQEWVTANRESFLPGYMNFLKTMISEVVKNEVSYFISLGGLNPFIFSDNKYQSYFNNCGQPKETVNPVVSLVINRVDDESKESYQEHLDFLRTSTGYQLMSISLPRGF